VYFYRSWINVFTQERLLCFDFFRRVYILLEKLRINKINNEAE